MGYDFVWNHKKGKSTNTVQMNMKLAKTVDYDYGISSKLICNECSGALTQLYRCTECDNECSIGQVKKREDKDNGIVFFQDMKKAFMGSEIEQKINVEKEIELDEVIINLPFVSSFYEIYNNDTKVTISTISKIHKWLIKHQKALLVSFGYRQKERAGIITASKDRLLLVEIRDYRLIRAPKQQEIGNVASKEETSINAVSENKEPELYEKFVKAVKKAKKAGKELEIKVPEKKKDAAVTVASFLED